MIELTEKNRKELTECFSEDKNIVIIGHHNPDGDAIGGSLGLYKILKNRNNKVSIVMPTCASDFLKWMPNYEKIHVFEDDKPYSQDLINKSDVLICIDFNDYSRVGKMEGLIENSDSIKILIDHHPGPDNRFDFIFSYTQLSSASEIVYNFVEYLDFNEFLDKESAICLFTGIMTDTINFSVNSSKEETFKVVSKLLSYGINKDEIYDHVYNNFSVDRLRLVGYLIHKKMTFIKDLELAYIVLTQKEMKKFNFKEGDHEGVVNMPLSVKGIKTSIIAIEKNDRIKTSSRSKDAIDVNMLSRKYFNGGGHKNAAGGTLYIPVSKVEEYIVKSIKDFIINSV